MLDYSGEARREGTSEGYKKEIETFNYTNLMPEGTKMVPRVLYISVGDIWTTNTILADPGSLKVGDLLKINTSGDISTHGLLTKGTAAGGDTDPIIAVVKVYTMPDLQPGVKLQRVG